jgi:hypothetical protein
MSKYSGLTDYLNDLAADGETESRISFSTIEEVLGQELPHSARQHRPWWANQGRAHSLAWENAGWKTANVDLGDEEISFLYVGDDRDEDTTDITPLTMTEAKAGLAAFFNVPVDAVEITIRG